ncbi:MAG: hypothetical protein WC515_01555 [Candidatus Omnitrophota bacterium]
MTSRITRREAFTAAVAFILVATFAVSIRLAESEDRFRYEARGKRDPFVSLVGPDKTVVASLEDIVSITDVNLEGIAVGSNGKRVAIINGEMTKEGYSAGMLQVKKITNKTVTLAIGGKSYDINLPEEGGTKREK